MARIKLQYNKHFFFMVNQISRKMTKNIEAPFLNGFHKFKSI